MTCNEAAELVSALCDGETIPREAAEHIGVCKACQALLTEYLEIGAELRRVASLAEYEAVGPLSLKRKRGAIPALWQKGWQTMRIPRFAFATLVVGIVALGLSLALAKVHAHSKGNVVLLTVAASDGPSHPCPLSTIDKKNSECGRGERVGSGYLSYSVRLLSKEDDRVRLGVRAEFHSHGEHGSSTDLKDVAEKQYSFEPGETLQIEVAGLGPLNVTGEWMDYMPYFGQLNLEHNLEPAPDELRIISPVLLKSKTVVMDFWGSSVIADQKDDLAWFYVPRDGLYELSLSQLPEAIEGHAENNRLSFTINGASYTLLTGAPIARNEEVWILHTPNVRPSGAWASHAVIGTEMLGHLIPRSKVEN
jgi:hypothetical protein